MSLVTEQMTVRPPEVAGGFYPAGHNECADMVMRCLAAARPSPAAEPKVIVAPHAGYAFSGAIAGTAFAPLVARRTRIKRVVIIGPVHRVGFKGLATTSADAWMTPLGTVPVDWPAMHGLLTLPYFRPLDAAFRQEHSLEVHVPFLQRVLDDFAIVPILVGEASHAEIDRALAMVWGGPETLISISSDLSHFHDYDTARGLDLKTTRSIEMMKPEEIDGQGACGHRAVGGALERARALDLRVTALDVRNSGDTRGGKDRVVGYGSYMMEYAEAARLSDDDRMRLLDAARASLKFGVENGRPPSVQIGPDVSPALTAMRACFVTLNVDGKLRGCIGSVVAHQPLIEDVVANAYKAGFGDQRFGPVTMEELERADLHVSILSTPRRMGFTDEADLVRQVRPDIDGLIMQDDGRRGLFLPSVWSGIPKAELFVKHLKRKSGLPADHWSDSLRVFRYSTESFGEGFQRA